jgi:hypothetical protein
MSTKAFDLKAPSKFEIFKIKNPKVEPGTTAPTHGPSDTLLSLMSIDTKNSVSTGNNHTIDFQGDFRPIFMALCFYTATNYDSLDVKQHSKVSPPTMLAYFLFVIYAYYLQCDINVRSSPSKHTAIFSSPEFLDVQHLLLNLPVPSILLKFLQACTPASDPRRPNISYVPSFACFSHYHDFGRYFPITILLLAHNFVISKRTNDAPEELMASIYALLFTENTGTDNFIGQLFAQHLTDGNNTASYGHQLAQSFESIINPALARSRSQRNVYSRINVHLQELNKDTNPYMFLMNLDDENMSETATLIRQLQTSISSKLPCVGTLGAVMSTLTGLNITIHSYSLYAVPTWHTGTYSKKGTHKNLSGIKFAPKIKFLDPPSTTLTTALKYPDDPATINKLLYLNEDDDSSYYPTEDDLTTTKGKGKKNSNFSTPPYYVLDPYDYNATTFHNVFLSGAMIESTSIDGSAVPHPNTDNTLDDENSLFLQSALPFSDITRSTIFDGTTVTYSERRIPMQGSDQPATTLLFDMTKNRFPYLHKTMHSAIPGSLPGFHSLHQIYIWNAIYNRLSFRIPTTDDQDNNRPPVTDKGNTLVWSPYRYFIGNVMSSKPENYFMITNLRTIYGTNPPLGEVSHFLEVMPVS